MDFKKAELIIEEIKADRQPVESINLKAFNTHKLIINGDRIYLFLTDMKANLEVKKEKN